MNSQLAVLVATAAANLALGLWVVLKDPSQKVNRYFCLLSISLAAWTLGNGFVSTYAGSPEGTIAARLTFASAAPIPLTFFLFASVFPSQVLSPPRWIGRLWLITGLATFLVSPTPLIVRATQSVGGSLHVTYGPLHPLFGLYILSCVGYSLVLLARKLTLVKGIERFQLRYVLLGISLTALAATFTNLLMPLLFKTSRFSPYGPVFSLLMIASIAHAIIRYRLMNTRLVIRRGVSYLLAVVIAAGVFALAVSSASALTGVQIHDAPVWIQFGLALVLALLFQPLKNLIQAAIDNYFFRRVYDYRTAVRDISRAMATILDFASLARFASEAISRIVRPEFVAVYTLDASAGVYTPIVVERNLAAGKPRAFDTIPATSHLVRFLSEQQHYLIAQGLRHMPPDRSIDTVLAQLAAIGGDFVLPIVQDNNLAGFLLLGPKLSGDAYFAEDVDLLTTLASQASIAFKNAQLYSQVVLANDYVENILVTMESAVISVSADGMITLFNPAAERLTGFRAAEMKEQPIQKLPTSIAALLTLTIRDNTPHTQLEIAIPDPAGRLIPVICSTSPLTDRTGHTFGVVAVFSDLTGLKQLERAKQQAERLASIGALAAGIAHEIKNPLVAIKTFAELIPERFADEDFRTDFSQVVIREIERIDDLVARLRGLALPAPQPLSAMDIRKPFEETLALLRGQLEQSQIAVHTDYPDEVPLIAADPAQLKQLFLNLLVNALEAMGPGGQLRITFSYGRSLNASHLVVEIRDSGSGIPEDMIDRIFDPFVTTKKQGSGLGLSICRGIAEAHRATIRAYNNTHAVGATIAIEFPVVEQDSSIR